MMRRITRKDVATAAGVSETIVSYVLNGNRYVNKEKRQRVLEAASRLGYRPNRAAIALRGKNTRHIVFIADDIGSEYFASVINAMENLMNRYGYLISLSTDRGNSDFVRMMMGWSFDGILIGSATISLDDIQSLIDTGMPVVILGMKDYPPFNGSYGVINTGLKGGVEEAISVLRSRGRKCIGFVDSLSSSGRSVDDNDFRYLGYLDAIGTQSPVVIDGCQSYDELAKAVTKVYAEKHFDALFCRTDLVAAETIIALKNAGLNLPQDVSIFGVNDDRIAKYSNPSISTIAIRKNKVAEAAFKLFSDLRESKYDSDNDQRFTIRLSTELVLRESI